jgi:hypothetical protein
MKNLFLVKCQIRQPKNAGRQVHMDSKPGRTDKQTTFITIENQKNITYYQRLACGTTTGEFFSSPGHEADTLRA